MTFTQNGAAVIGFSCCGVPALIFRLLLVYCYVLITSVCISTVFFFCILQGKAKKIKEKIKVTNTGSIIGHRIDL